MMDMIKDKLKAMDDALRSIEKQFGKGSIMRLGDQKAESVPSISTGSPSLDAALGCGGYPRGRVVEIFGPEAPYERGGDVGNVAFPCGYTLGADGDAINLYYGAADTSVALATGSVRELLSWLDKHAGGSDSI